MQIYCATLKIPGTLKSADTEREGTVAVAMMTIKIRNVIEVDQRYI